MSEDRREDPQTPARRRARISRVGIVVSDRMDKTATVAIERMIKHRTYKRFVRRTARFLAHDQSNSAHIGDRVEIVATRKLSKNKHWRIARIIEKSAGKGTGE